MPKRDMKKKLKHLYLPSAKEVAMVDVPEMSFLMIDGSGDPNTSQGFQEAFPALYGVAYTLKFMVKQTMPESDYGVMPPEGLWWADDMGAFTLGAKNDWKWTLMIAQPDFVTADMVGEAIEQVRKKRNPPALPKLRFERYHEGLSAQILHVGPYADEAPTIERLHRFIGDGGYELAGKHHEIYLSDPQRAAPEKMKTVLRQPIRARQAA